MPTTLNKVASAARTVDGNSGLLLTGPAGATGGDWESMTLGVHVTAVGTVTLDLAVEWLISDALTSLGNATYDETGGAEEDLWTLASHGLQVNDQVEFSAVGTGATGYAVSTLYHVAAVDSVNTFRLSQTRGGSVIEGTDDSGGTWTLAERYAYASHPAGADDFKPASSDTAFAQITGVGTVCETFRVRGDAYRIVWTIGGASPSATFSISEHVV